MKRSLLWRHTEGTFTCLMIMIDEDKQKSTGRQGLVGNAPYISNVSGCPAVSLDQKPQYVGVSLCGRHFGEEFYADGSESGWEHCQVSSLRVLSFTFARGEATETHLRLIFIVSTFCQCMCEKREDQAPISGSLFCLCQAMGWMFMQFMLDEPCQFSSWIIWAVCIFCLDFSWGISVFGSAYIAVFRSGYTSL